jgi:hypothetical protein
MRPNIGRSVATAAKINAVGKIGIAPKKSVKKFKKDKKKVLKAQTKLDKVNKKGKLNTKRGMKIQSKWANI